MYGSDWHVRAAPVKGPKNNVAYTTAELDLHLDLAYYESTPGLQLLHMQRNDRVVGGESFFLDAFYVAEVFKKEHPAHFKTLCEVPAAFIKDDLDRPVPAQYHYSVPHIECNDLGQVIKVWWSPAFEAPLPANPRMKEYYAARRYFVDTLNKLRKTHQVEFQMSPGECVVFVQARVLHARRGFSEPEPGCRQLHGCYVNIDHWRNAVCAAFPDEDMHVRFANRSWR